MTTDKIISTGMIITDTKSQTKYRIIFISEEMVMLCNMNSSYLDLLPVTFRYISEQIGSSAYEISQDSPYIVEIEKISEKGQKAFSKSKEFIHDFDSIFGPSYFELINSRGDANIRNLSEKYSFSSKKTWKLIRLYLQSGMNPYAILDKRCAQKSRKEYNYRKKTGRPCANNFQQGVPLTDKIRKIFDEAINDYRNGRMKSYQSVYDFMIGENFNRFEMDEYGKGYYKTLPVDEYPTFKQFYHYASKSLTPKELAIIKSSYREYFNNFRPILSDTLHNVQGPGYMVEMDEWETGIYLVSSVDRTRCIGKAVFYAMVDVYTRAIVAFHVGLENNSILGFTNCFANLGEDKMEFCRKYGTDLVNPENWPSNFLPANIRLDHGAEYVSREVNRIFADLNISHSYVPGGTGSFKAVVEQLFHQISVPLNAIMEKHGLVEKRHDSNHKETACITLEELTQITLTHVLAHNQLQMKRYPLTAEMIAAKVPAIPVHLWKFGLQKYGEPRPIANASIFAYTILQDITKDARLSRKGIKFKGLYYFNYEDTELCRASENIMKKSIEFSCRIDPRDISCIYYIRCNEIMKAELNPRVTGNTDYKGMTLFEYLEVRKIRSETEQDYRHIDQQVRSDRQHVIANQTKAARKKSKEPVETQKIREYRKDERARHNNENAIASRLALAEMDDSSLQINYQEESAEKENTILNDISLEDALAAFND